jgi:hypothetical protein
MKQLNYSAFMILVCMFIGTTIFRDMDIHPLSKTCYKSLQIHHQQYKTKSWIVLQSQLNPVHLHHFLFLYDLL